MSAIGRILTNVLEEKDLSQKWLANAAGITPATLNRWIKGENDPPSLDTLVAIAKALNVSTDYLLGISPVPFVKKDFRTEEKILVNCYRRASEDDVNVLWALMGRYMAPNERIFMSQFDIKTEDIG